MKHGVTHGGIREIATSFAGVGTIHVATWQVTVIILRYEVVDNYVYVYCAYYYASKKAAA